MTLKARIKRLCELNKKSMNQVEKDLGFGSGYLSKLDNSTPNTKKIQQIADYFNVSVSYLLVGEKYEKVEETAKTDIYLTQMPNELKGYALKLAKLPKEKQDLVLKMIDELGK